MGAPENGLATREKLQELAGQRRYKTAEIEGFGKVRIRSLTAGEMLAINDRGDEDDDGPMAIRLIIAAVVDADGNPVFRESDEVIMLTVDSGVMESLANEVNAFLSGPAKN
jgi:hypothetical protein